MVVVSLSEVTRLIVFSAFSREISRKITLEPCNAKSSTVAAPIPEAPPDIRTVLPRRLG